MSMLLYDIKKGKKFTYIMLSALMAFFTLALGSVAVIHHFFNPNRDDFGANGLPKVPLASYVPATYETFDCFSSGPSECDKFDTFVSSMAASPTDFTYDPLAESDPGTLNRDGTRTVSLSSGLSEEDWQALGVAVTQDQTLNGAQINVNSVSVADSVATVAIPKGAGDDNASVTANITFEFSGAEDNPSSVQVTGVTYGPPGGKG